MPETPLRPDEMDTYKTAVQTQSEASDADADEPGRDSRLWIALGLVLLVLFIMTLLAAIAFGVGR